MAKARWRRRVRRASASGSGVIGGSPPADFKRLAGVSLPTACDNVRRRRATAGGQSKRRIGTTDAHRCTRIERVQCARLSHPEAIQGRAAAGGDLGLVGVSRSSRPPRRWRRVSVVRDSGCADRTQRLGWSEHTRAIGVRPRIAGLWHRSGRLGTGTRFPPCPHHGMRSTDGACGCTSCAAGLMMVPSIACRASTGGRARGW